MQANSHRPDAPFPLSSLFAELDSKLTQALSDTSFLDPCQWKDVTRRLNKLRVLLSVQPDPDRQTARQASPAYVDTSLFS